MKLNNVASRWEFLKTMPTQDLDEMLQAELHKENIDDDLVQLILEVLEKRETDRPVEINAEVTAAVNKYTTYLDGLEKAPAKPTRKWSVMLKVASVLLVAGLLLFAVPQTVQAESFFEMLARWTDSIFEFFSPGDDNKQPEYVFETDHPGLQQIYDAVVELGVTDPVVPMWVPEGYELKNVKTDEWPTETTLYADLRKDESCITITIILRNEGVPFQHSKDIQNVETHEIAGVKHYVMSNYDEITATWIIDCVECSIVTDCQGDYYKILESIYSMEG